MAVLTNEDGITIWRNLYRNPKSKAVIKANGDLPSTKDLKSIFQVFEDLWTRSDVANKMAIDGIMGAPMTTQQVKEFGKAWFTWRAE